MAEVEVAVRKGKLRELNKVEVTGAKLPTDWTERIELGLVVPMPTLPEESTMKAVLWAMMPLATKLWVLATEMSQTRSIPVYLMETILSHTASS